MSGIISRIFFKKVDFNQEKAPCTHHKRPVVDSPARLIATRVRKPDDCLKTDQKEPLTLDDEAIRRLTAELTEKMKTIYSDIYLKTMQKKKQHFTHFIHQGKIIARVSKLPHHRCSGYLLKDELCTVWKLTQKESELFSFHTKSIPTALKYLNYYLLGSGDTSEENCPFEIKTGDKVIFIDTTETITHCATISIKSESTSTWKEVLLDHKMGINPPTINTWSDTLSIYQKYLTPLIKFKVFRKKPT